MIVDEGDHDRNRRSSSAWAKYALAFLRISLACRSSRFSRSSALIRSRSSVVGPARTPRRARPDGPTCAAFRQSNRFWPRSTGSPIANRARSHAPGQPDCPLANLRGKGWGMLRHGSSLSRVGASENPGAIQADRAARGGTDRDAAPALCRLLSELRDARDRAIGRSSSRHPVRSAAACGGDVPEDLTGALVRTAVGGAFRPVRPHPQPGGLMNLLRRAQGCFLSGCDAAIAPPGAGPRSSPATRPACGSKARTLTTGCSTQLRPWCTRLRRLAAPS